MKTNRISVCKTPLHYTGGIYGWGGGPAIHIARARHDLDFNLKKLCESYEKCKQDRRVASQPMKLDECMTGLRADHGAEICCRKVSNLGGLSNSSRVHESRVENGIQVVAEDTWSGGIAATVVAQFSAPSPEEYLANSADLMNDITCSADIGGAFAGDGKLSAPDAPSLGVVPGFASRGVPVALFGEPA